MLTLCWPYADPMPTLCWPYAGPMLTQATFIMSIVWPYVKVLLQARNIPAAAPLPEEKFIPGVIYSVLLWADMNAATPVGAWGCSIIAVVRGHRRGPPVHHGGVSVRADHEHGLSSKQRAAQHVQRGRV